MAWAFQDDEAQPRDQAILMLKPGDRYDRCSLCGIHRENAGFLKATCGDGYLQPECFVTLAGSSDMGGER